MRGEMCINIESSLETLWSCAAASVPDWLRYSAVVAGFVAFMLSRKSIFAGVICGEIAMVAGKWWLG